jgi:hypothetical protein
MPLPSALCYCVAVFHNQSMEYIPTQSQYRERHITTLEVLRAPETKENRGKIVMEMGTNAKEKRAKTSINLKKSLRNAAVKHLIDLTGSTEVSQAIELALEQWLSAKPPSTSQAKGPLQIVSHPSKIGAAPNATEVSQAEHGLILKLLRCARDRRTEGANLENRRIARCNCRSS